MSDFQIPVLSTFVGWLAGLMASAVQFFYNMTESFGYPSYGIAIIMLTLAIKFMLLPLALKQIKSMKGMQEIQPKIQALQRKYKNDRTKLSMEMQKLYREHNFSIGRLFTFVNSNAIFNLYILCITKFSL